MRVSPTGRLCALAEDELQSGVYCLDSLESIESVCGVGPQVSADSFSPSSQRQGRH